MPEHHFIAALNKKNIDNLIIGWWGERERKGMLIKKKTYEI